MPELSVTEIWLGRVMTNLIARLRRIVHIGRPARRSFDAHVHEALALVAPESNVVPITWRAGRYTDADERHLAAELARFAKGRTR